MSLSFPTKICYSFSLLCIVYLCMRVSMEISFCKSRESSKLYYISLNTDTNHLKMIENYKYYMFESDVSKKVIAATNFTLS